jgi:hypothetical protein
VRQGAARLRSRAGRQQGRTHERGGGDRSAVKDVSRFVRHRTRGTRFTPAGLGRAGLRPRDNRMRVRPHHARVKHTLSRSWGPLLLILGGVLFAWIGLRSLALERAASARARQVRLELIRSDLRVDAERLMRAPRGRPLLQWRVEPTRLRATEEEVLAHGSVQREAERVLGLPAAEALAAWERLLADDQPERVRLVAAAHAARAAQTLSKQTHERLYWERAAKAPPGLRDFSTPSQPVRLLALGQLAYGALLQRGEAGPLDIFLREVEDGVRIAEGPEAGPGRVTIALQEQVEAAAAELNTSGRALPRAALLRLEHAADHARRGLRILRLLPADGVCMIDPHWGMRSGVDIWLYPVSALFEGDFGAPVAATRVLRPDEQAAFVPSDHEVVLDPPFDRVVLSLVPEAPGGEDRIALFALVLGLFVYAAGSILVVGGWRRTRRAALQQADFVASVSHELKTPIASVRAMAELLAESAGPEGGRARLYAERIEYEMQRLGATVRNVLDAAQIERGTLPVSLRAGDPGSWLAEVGERLAPGLEARGVAFTSSVEPAAGPFSFDPEALEGVVLNFVDNAVKFSPAEKILELRGRRGTRGAYHVEVLDRGRGIDGEDEDRLFGRFYRGVAARDGAAPGVGLGLHIARQVADRHGARLYAHPRRGGGAVFGLELRRTP